MMPIASANYIAKQLEFSRQASLTGVATANRGAIGGIVGAKSLGFPATGRLGGFVRDPGDAGFGAAYLPRWTPNGEHMNCCGSTYAVRGALSHLARPDARWGPYEVIGCFSGRRYAGGLSKPVQLPNGTYSYCGNTYPNLASVYQARFGPVPIRPGRQPLGFLASYVSGPPGALGRALESAPKATSSDTASILSQPGLSIEAKILLLMSKMSEYFDDELDKKLDEANNHMLNKGNNDANSSSNLQTKYIEIQSLMQSRQQMFQTMSSILKSVHDTSMAAVRNLRA